MTQPTPTDKKVARIKLRWKIIIGTIGTIFILLLIAIAILLSPVGLKIALHIIKNRLPGTLTYQSANGKPLGPISINNLQYTYANNTLTAKRIKIDWEALGFAKLDIWLRTLEIDDAHLNVDEDPVTWIRAQLAHKSTPSDKKSTTKSQQQWQPFWMQSNLRIENIDINNFTLSNIQQKKIWQLSSLTGDINWGPKRLDSHVDLLVSFPEAAQVTLETQGTPNNYNLELDATGPATNWQIIGNGDQEHMVLKTVRSKLWGGSLTGTTTLNWQPQLNWQINWQAKNLKPAMIWKNRHSPIRLPSNLSATVTGQGKNDSGSIQWKNLSAKLKQQNFTGQGNITFNDNKLDAIQSSLKSKQTSVYLNGTYTTEWLLKWRVRSSDLSIFSNLLHGRINANGQLLGDRLNPTLIGTLNASNIAWKSTGFRRIVASWDIESQQSSPVTMSLLAIGPRSKTQIIQALNLQLSGDTLQHNLIAKGKTPYNHWVMQLTGKKTADQWQAMITKWNIHANNTSTQWGLKQPVAISYSKVGLNVSDLELMNKTSNIKFNTNWKNTKQAEIYLSTNNWPLHPFQPWLPPMLKISGSVSGESHITIDDGYLKKWENNWHLSAGNWNIKLPNNSNFKFHVSQANLSSVLKGKTLSLKVTGGAGKKTTWHVELNLPDYAELHMPRANQIIKGKIALSSPKIKPLQTIIPDIDELRGKIFADCKIGGTWSKPQLFGDISLQNGRVTLTKYNTKLDNISAKISASGQIVNFRLRAESQGKPLLFSGISSFTPQSITATAKLTGNDVLIWDTDSYTFYATPDLYFKLNGTKLKLTGKVNLPQGSIHPRTFKGANTLPEDVVVIHPGIKSSKPTYHFQSNITLFAGDGLSINASGINGKVRGKITVIAGTKEVTVANGRLYLTEGTYTTQGRTLQLSTGELNFRQSPLDNPFLNIRATRTIKRAGTTGLDSASGPLVVGMTMRGTLKKPQINYFSSPIVLTQQEIVSYIVLGQSTSGGAGGLALISQAVSSLSVSNDETKQKSVTQEIEQGLNLDEFGFEPTQQADPLGAPLQESDSFVIGKNISRRIYLRYSVNTGVFDKGRVVELRYTLTPQWSLQGNVGAEGASNDIGADVFYTIEKN